MAQLDELYSYGYDLRRLARDLLEHFRNLATAKVAAGSELLSELPDDERAELDKQAQAISGEDLDRCFRILLDTEAEIARVPYPKLVFDMTVIKLATLPPLLSADDLLASIDAARDQGGGARSTTDAPAARAPHRSFVPAPAPRRAAASNDDEPAPAVEAAASDAPVSWVGFLDFVRTNKITLLTYLEACTPPDLSGAALELNVAAGYYFNYLNQGDHLQLVEQLARQYFRRPLKVIVSAAAPALPAEPAAPQPSAAELHAEAVDNPTVKAAVEILGGEIREVRQRRKRIEENT